jgi:predicted phosphohydrolase
VALFAISDLHLSFGVEKPMDIFGKKWEGHHFKIKENWQKVVRSHDTVILGGDLSWALKLKEADRDFDFVDRLPGTKVLFKGNHDYWWQSYAKVKKALPKSIYAVQNNFFVYESDIALCGTRGWTFPEGNKAEDKKIYRRELIRLELSLNEAYQQGLRKYVVTLHYPPITASGEESDFVEIMKKYGVKICIYGHLHGADHEKAFMGERDGIHYYFTSSDYLDFTPLGVNLDVFG